MSEDLNLEEMNENVSGDEEPILKRESNLDNFDIPSSASDLEAVYDIPVKVSAILGKSKIKVSQLLKINKGTIIELDKKYFTQSPTCLCPICTQCVAKSNSKSHIEHRRKLFIL